ncbi:MAG: molecular chaperone TorD family protein [Methanomicrobia archaeon]|nr:molecular chaperone TorD family protein [Methanomicrobia archaeon]
MNELNEILEMRRDFYAFLTRLYVEAPARELVEDLVTGRLQFQQLAALEVNDDLSTGSRLLTEFAEKSKGRTVDELHEELVKEYTLLFIGPHRLPVQPFEAWWVSGKLLGEPLVKVKRAYQKAGIAKSSEFSEPEDHIGFELKFMHYLGEQAAVAEVGPRLKEWLTLQREFLDEHLAKWAPRYCDALYEYELSNFYKGVAKLTKGFIMLDTMVLTELVDSVG